MLMGLIFVGLVLCAAFAEGQIKSSFSCDGRVAGYYADVGTGCQVYHMCDGLGRRFSFTCPNATLFQQRMLICDHWFMVNCSRSESEYGTNLLIGQKETPFVGETGQSSFQRTPRPDYTLIRPDKAKEIYQRTPDPSEDSNVIHSEEQNNIPTSWSTEYVRPDPTVNPKGQFQRRQDQQSQGTERTSSVTLENRLSNSGNKQEVNNYKTIVNFESNYKATTPVYPQIVDESQKMNDLDLVPPKNQPVITRIEDINNLQSTEYTQEEDTSVPVNFESHFKATTPVYPKFVDDALKLVNLELSPPILQSQNENVVDDKTQNIESNNPVVVNFESRFKATTPVYPKFVDNALKFNDLDLSPPSSMVEANRQTNVNFESNFKATTPVYPLSVEATSPIPDGVGLLPPLEDTPRQNQQFLQITTRKPVNFESNFAATIPNYPQSVEATSPLPDEVGLLPPSRNDISGRLLNFQPTEDENHQGQSEKKENEEPSLFYEPPLFETGYVDPNGALASYKSNYDHVISPKIDDWNALKRRYSVPDFDFPLDSEVKRASYESDRSSFQPRPAGSQVR